MKRIAIPEFLYMLDKPNILTVTFLAEVLKTYNLEGDFFFFEMRKNEKMLEDTIKRTARNRKWKLRNLTVFHMRRRLLGKMGEACLMITAKTPQQFADFCNRLYRMRAFL